MDECRNMGTVGRRPFVLKYSICVFVLIVSLSSLFTRFGVTHEEELDTESLSRQEKTCVCSEMMSVRLLGENWARVGCFPWTAAPFSGSTKTRSASRQPSAPTPESLSREGRPLR